MNEIKNSFESMDDPELQRLRHNNLQAIKNLKYKIYEQYAISKIIEDGHDVKKRLLTIEKVLEETNCVSLQKVPKQKKANEYMLEEFECNIACTTTAQQNTENIAKFKNIKFLEQLEQEITEVCKELSLTMKRMTTNVGAARVKMSNMPSKVDNKKIELISYNEYLRCIETMHQEEINRIYALLRWHCDRHDEEVQIAMDKSDILQQIEMKNKMLDLEDKLLKFNLKREQMTTNVEAVGVEMTDMPSEVDDEKSKLMRETEHLQSAEAMHMADINNLYAQLQMYCNKYNMPIQRVNIATHRDFVMQKIEMIKKLSALEVEVMDFDLETGRMTMNVEADDVGMTKSKVDDEKKKLIKHNEYLRSVAMMHQEEIIRVKAELKRYSTRFSMSMKRVKISIRMKVETDYVKNDEMRELMIDNEYLRVIGKIHQEKINKIYVQLQMYCDKYDMSNEKLKIAMHLRTDAVEMTNMPSKIDGEEQYIFDLTYLTNMPSKSELMKNNTYFRFVARMHQEMINKVCAHLQVYCYIYNENVKIVTRKDFIMQKMEISAKVLDLERGLHEIYERFYCNEDALNFENI